MSSLRERVGEIVAALRKIANRDLDEGDLPGMGEEVMLEDAIKTATDALARYKDKGATYCPTCNRMLEGNGDCPKCSPSTEAQGEPVCPHCEELLVDCTCSAVLDALTHVADNIDVLRSRLRSLPQQESEHYARLMKFLDRQKAEVHPNYGPCDGFANGWCSECKRILRPTSGDSGRGVTTLYGTSMSEDV